MEDFYPKDPVPLINDGGRIKRNFLSHVRAGGDGTSRPEDKKRRTEDDNNERNSKEEEEEEEEHGRRGYRADGRGEPEMATGYPWGPNSGSADGGCLFKLLRGKRALSSDGSGLRDYERISDDLEHLTLDKFGALPSYCPWIEYDLLVVLPPGTGSTYRVTRVVDCRTRRIDKAELVSYLCRVRGSADREAAVRDRKRFLSRLRRVPKVILDLDEDVGRIMDEDSGSLDARDLNDDLCHRIYKILDPATKGPVFAHLLRYFSSGFLLRFDDAQLCFFLFVATTRPDIFLFWDSLYDLAKRIRIRGERLFDRDRLRSLEVHPKYALPQKFGGRREEMLAYSDYQPVSYSVKFPAWSVKKLRYAVEDLGASVGDDDLDSWIYKIGDVADLYLRMEANFYSFGSTSFDPRRLFPEPFVLKRENLETIHNYDLLTVVMEEEVDVPPTSTGNATETESRPRVPANVRLMKRCVNDAETKLARLLKYNCSGIKIFSCPYYDDVYFERLLDFLMGSTSRSEGSVWTDETVICSASSSTASYVSRKIGLSVMSAEDWVEQFEAGLANHRTDPEWVRGEGSSVTRIVVDRAHKISTRLLSRLLSVVIKGSGDASKMVEVVLFGDLEEYPAKAVRGGGNLMADVANSAPESIVRWRMEWKEKTGTCAVYERLKNRSTVGLDVVTLKENHNACEIYASFLKEVGLKEKDRDANLRFVCSNRSDARELSSSLAAKNFPTNDNSFRIGQAVHLPDKDVRGMLKRAWIVDRGPNNEDLVTAVHHVPFYATDREESLRGMMQISGKTEIETDRNVYFLEVDDLVYLTSCVSVRHGIVCVASEYLGAPVPYAIYYVTENTKLRDVTCTLKYFTSRVKFVTKSGCKFQSLYESRNAKRSDPETDLTNKLSNDVPR